jgi:ribonuclease HII
MVKLHELFPSYEWNSNKGYLSPTHISAIKISVSVSTIEHNMLEIF